MPIWCLLAKDNEGYKNLMRLCSIGFVEGYYYKPRIDYDTLRKYAEGLVCLSACIGGRCARASAAGGEKQKAYRIGRRAEGYVRRGFLY